MELTDENRKPIRGLKIELRGEPETRSGCTEGGAHVLRCEVGGWRGRAPGCKAGPGRDAGTQNPRGSVRSRKRDEDRQERELRGLRG